MKPTKLADGIVSMEGVLSSAECAALISRVEDIGFEVASIATAKGAVIDHNVRNNDRVIVDDPSLASDLWSRVSSAIPDGDASCS
jgi:prolyl 4-hydroxylase